jgi:hypothetical protein
MYSRKVAIPMLILATAAWGYSFPGGKALMAAFSAELPGRNEWFYSALMISARFALAALVLLGFQPKVFSRIRASECRQGFGLGVFAGFGMLLQADGLQYTTASAVAFLTQFAAVLVPIFCMFRDRRAPSIRTIVCVLMVITGVAILGQFDWKAMSFGRGELETLLATAFFTAQILWLDRPVFRGNDTLRVSMIMFATCAAVVAPVWMLHLHSAADLAAILLPKPSVGIVYCAEPLFATVLALFLPQILGRFLGIHYPNETFTSHLLVGGGLITLANILISLAPQKIESEEG